MVPHSDTHVVIKKTQERHVRVDCRKDGRNTWSIFAVGTLTLRWWNAGNHLWDSALSALNCFPRTLWPPGVAKKPPCLCVPAPSSTSWTWIVTCTDRQIQIAQSWRKLALWNVLDNTPPAVAEVCLGPTGQWCDQLALADWLIKKLSVSPLQAGCHSEPDRALEYHADTGPRKDPLWNKDR